MAKKKTESGGTPAKNPTGDEGTQEILDEMEDEGLLEEEEEEEKSDDNDEEEEDEEEDEDDDDSDDDEEDDEEEEDDDDEEGDEDEDEDDDENADDDDDDEDGDGKPDGRKARFIPKWQHKKELKQQEKRLRAELSGAAQEASQTAEDVDEDSDEVKDIVKKFGLPEETGPAFVATIINAAAKKAGKAIPTEDLKKMQKAIADQEEDRQFQREMRKAESKLTKLFPNAKKKDLERIKKKLTRMAYTERYEKYSIVDIATLNAEKLQPKKKKKTGETSGGKGKKTKVKATKRFNLDEPDSIPWADLDDDTFDELSAELEKRTGTGLKVTKKNRTK